MNFLSAEQISKTFSDRWLFKNASLGISQGQKVALVGINGSGKSTLLNVLSGKLPPDSGTVTFRKGISVGYLDQEPVFNEEQTITESILSSGTEILNAIRQYEKSLADPENKGLQEAMEKMDALNAWDYDSTVKEIIAKVGLGNLDRQIKTLSGGQRKRVALARILIEDPEFIIMDEPTNHLDIETIEWLEIYLSNKNKTLLLVTHDRYFLDEVADQIIELDNGNIYKYNGNYSYFIEKKAEREMIQDAEVDKAKNLMRKELDWIRRQPKARGTKAKYRVDAFEDLKEKASQKRVVQKLELNVKTSRLGGKIIEVEKISKSFPGQPIVKDFSYVFKKKDRIGIVGKNGSGKTTFLNMLIGQGEPDSGKIDRGDTTSFGYFSQTGLKLKEDKRVIEVVKDIADVIATSDGESITASQFLQHFMFPPAMQYTPVSKLSGGEKKRLYLLTILIKNPNFLILDEPTNDLDLVTLSVLEEFLLKFNGCLIIVSHDRYFMDKLCDHLFIFEQGGQIRDFPGNYSQYRAWAEEQSTLQIAAPLHTSENTAAPLGTGGERKKVSYQEKREYEDLEKEIAGLEEQKRSLIEKMNAGPENHVLLAGWASEIENISSLINSKSERWLELAEKMEL
jgi:ATP-binding cassette subfamily F protein uup